MSNYKVIIRNSPGWRSFDACTLGISVTSPNWQDEHFASILDFAAENFKVIRIDVTDLLYRHTFMAEGMPPAQAENRAGELGEAWLERHRPIIEACTVKPDVIRWGRWYEHPDFSDTLDSFNRVYRTSPALRDAIDEDIDGFFRRQGRQPSPAEHHGSRDYLVEEVAVMTLQVRAMASLRIYPGDELACLNVVRSGLVADAPRGLEREQFAKVKFHTRGNAAAKEMCAHQAPCPVPAAHLPERRAPVAAPRL